MNNLLVSNKELITTITVNRPKQLNALNISTIKELGKAFNNLKNDKNTRVIVLTGAGEKSFVAGADIKEFSNYDNKQGTDLSRSGHLNLFNLIEDFPKPVIAAINGYALGGGLELALSAHIRVASKNSKLGLPEVSLGVIPGYGGTQRLTNLVGKGRAMEYILTAKMIGVEDAKHSGLINEYCELEDLLPTCENIARKIIKNSPRAISKAIKCINASLKNERGFETEIEEFGKCFQTDDFVEGTTAFLEKRKPKYN